MSWYNRELNQVLGIKTITDIVHKPIQLEDEIKFTPNPLSNIPPQYRRYFHCVVCLYPFECDTRKRLQTVECPNGHVYRAVNKYGTWTYKYRPDIPPTNKRRNTFTAAEIKQREKRSVDGQLWGKTK